MQEIDAKHFHLIAGAGNFADNRGSNGRVNNNGGNKNGGGSSNQGFYGKHTSPDCVNGVLTGSLGALAAWRWARSTAAASRKAAKAAATSAWGKAATKTAAATAIAVKAAIPVRAKRF
ncbi:hypothetical protein [Serratia marcescens]|uniref:hypothetical protein n=1 Tax=Serratia marcescens TaxID=615 RepID=UPI0038B34F51